MTMTYNPCHLAWWHRRADRRRTDLQAQLDRLGFNALVLPPEAPELIQISEIYLSGSNLLGQVVTDDLLDAIRSVQLGTSPQDIYSIIWDHLIDPN